MTSADTRPDRSERVGRIGDRPRAERFHQDLLTLDQYIAGAA